MAACPNCGRKTYRTLDWVCQWCGYPLLSGGFPSVEKTYKEFCKVSNDGNTINIKNCRTGV